MLKSLLYLLNALVFLGGACIGVIAAIDELGDPTPQVIQTPAEASARPSYAGSGRVFVLFVDSLRDRTAESAELMPNLVALSKTATHAQVETVYDAITAPAVRAAFTGRSHFRVLGFVQNFVKRAQKLPSLFTQITESGGETFVFSDKKTFAQFGRDIHKEYPNEAGEGGAIERENEQARHALELFNTGKPKLVIFHSLYLDHVAHQRGIAHAEYRDDAARLDGLVAELAAGVPDEDTFVVLGDHGHTETGRHALGLDVPTFVMMRGPGFRHGVDLGLVHISEYRYLLSWALKLPLAADYSRGRRPEAFAVPPAEIPTSFAQVEAARAARTNPPLTLFVGLALVVGVAFAFWWTIGEVIHAGSWRGFSRDRFLKTLAASAALAPAFMAAGVALASLRSDVHEPFFPTILRIWSFVLLAMLLVTRRFDLGKTALIVLGVPFVLLWPSTYRYGAPAVFVPAWLCWATCAVVLSFGFQDGLPTAKYYAIGKRWRVRKSVVLYLGTLLLTQSFFFTDAVNFVFTNFRALSPEVSPTALWSQALFGSAAVGILFFRSRDPWASAAFSSVFACYFLAVFFHVIPEGTRANFFLGVALLALAGAVRRKVRMGLFHAQAQGMARALFLAALIVFYFYFVRVSSETRVCALMLFAALRLSVLLLDHLPMARRNIRLNALFLQIVGVIASGWVTLSWGLERLEWYAAYDFFPPRLVEEYVWLFLPFIVLKYSLPVLITRMLIVERVGLEKGYPGKEVVLFAGFKFATLILLTLGIGFYTAGSGVYLEAVGQLAIFMSLAASLL